MTCAGFPAKYNFRSRSGCNDSDGRCRTHQAALARASGQPTTPRRRSQRKNPTSLASPGSNVLSTSKNAAIDVSTRRCDAEGTTDICR
jgi:hypothetical protein